MGFERCACTVWAPQQWAWLRELGLVWHRLCTLAVIPLSGDPGGFDFRSCEWLLAYGNMVFLLNRGQMKIETVHFNKIPGKRIVPSDKQRGGNASFFSYNHLYRERIKSCCEQLRTLLPYVKGRKSDVASVIEATVDYVKQVRESLSPAIMAQVLSFSSLIHASMQQFYFCSCYCTSMCVSVGLFYRCIFVLV